VALTYPTEELDGPQRERLAGSVVATADALGRRLRGR
jgi:hypothetical protein